MREMQLNELESMWDQSESLEYDEYGKEGSPAGDDGRGHHRPSVTDGGPGKSSPSTWVYSMAARPRNVISRCG